MTNLGNRWVLVLIAVVGIIVLLAWHGGGEEPLRTIETDVAISGSAR
ncbi:hypothetical protein [Qipengyuania sp.]